jgi:8-oxo-dGTP pyrophosphatase MutT (NUDIX family)
MSNPVFPAATVAVLRDGPHGLEVFMVKRSSKTRFMPHAHVFPGGRVDPEDSEVSMLGGDQDRERMSIVDAAAYQAAAIRETYEESGILLADGQRDDDARAALHEHRESLAQVAERMGWTLWADRLVYWSWWLTPESEPRRYDTRFFIAVVDPDTMGAHDNTETVQSGWWTPADALACFEQGDILLAPPTARTLQELVPYTTTAEAMVAGRTRRTPQIEPRLHMGQDGVLEVVLPGDPEFPAPISVEGPTRMHLRYAQPWLDGDKVGE